MAKYIFFCPFRSQECPPPFMTTRHLVIIRNSHFSLISSVWYSKLKIQADVPSSTKAIQQLISYFTGPTYANPLILAMARVHNAISIHYVSIRKGKLLWALSSVIHITGIMIGPKWSLGLGRKSKENDHSEVDEISKHKLNMIQGFRQSLFCEWRERQRLNSHRIHNFYKL